MVIPCGERYQQTLYLLKKSKGKLVAEVVAADAVRADDRQGRSSNARSSPIPPTRRSKTAASRASPASHRLPPAGTTSGSSSWSRTRDAPEGKYYITFKNSTPGRGSQALQGFAVDGRKVVQLRISARVRGHDIRPGQRAKQLAAIVVNFYDESRVPIGEAVAGSWRGTFDWQSETRSINVPLRAREAHHVHRFAGRRGRGLVRRHQDERGEGVEAATVALRLAPASARGSPRGRGG